MHARRLLLVLAPLALVGGCGGDGDFKGGASVPEAYKTYKRDGVSIAYPERWKVNRRQDSDGGSSTRITPAKQQPTPFGLILLSASPDAEKRFDNQVKGRRGVMKAVSDAKFDSDKEVDVPGAKEARRLQATVPPKGGSDPVEVKVDSLDLLRENGDTLTVVVAAPQRDDDKDELDPAKVIESLRLSG
jgi:hypothetical protein